MCKTNGCTQSCGCDEKHFTSEINYDGAKIPCLDPEGTIKPPYTSLNTFLQYLATKLCDLIALGGVPGSIDWATVGGTGVVSGTGSGTVNSLVLHYGVAGLTGKTFFVNFYANVSVTGNIGDTIILDFDISGALPSNISGTTYQTICNMDIVATPIQPPLMSRASALVGTKTLQVNAIKLPANYVNELMVVVGQIFLKTI